MDLLDQIASNYTLTFFLLFFGGVFIGAVMSSLVNGIFFWTRVENRMSDLQMNDLTNHYRVSDLEAEIKSLRQHVQSLKLVEGEVSDE